MQGRSIVGILLLLSLAAVVHAQGDRDRVRQRYETTAGDAKFDPPARNPRIGKELEGKWVGTLDVNGVPMRVSLTLVNQPDGSSTGSLANLDQGGVEIAVSNINQTASSVTIDVKIVNGSFSGTLNAEGTRLSGTWSQRTFTGPLIFQKQ